MKLEIKNNHFLNTQRENNGETLGIIFGGF
jgi:hypothetical protein